MNNSTNQLRQSGKTLLPRLVLAMTVAILGLPASQALSQGEEGYDLMRVVTSQWVKPFLYFSLDKSGSMHMTFDQSYNSKQRWYFNTTDKDGYISLKDDFKVGNHGIGNGFWLRVGEGVPLLDEGFISWTDDNQTWATGWVDHDYPANIYSPNSEPALSKGQLIQVMNYPIDGVNGIYLVTQESRNSGHNPGWYYTKFARMQQDGTFTSSNFSFPLNSGSGNARDVKPFSFRRVLMKTDPTSLQASGNTAGAKMKSNQRWKLLIKLSLSVQRGDIVRLTGFSNPSNNGIFFIREKTGSNKTYNFFKASKMDRSGQFPDTVFNFQGPTDGNGHAEIMHLATIASSRWTFVPATRITIAKNVWGKDLTVYEPLPAPTGYDKNGKPYYIFKGHGPTNGAWLEWRNSGDNGYGHIWHNWSWRSGVAPAGDPDYTRTQAPSRMTEHFARVAHVGLILYSGSCPSGVFTPKVKLDPEVSDAVVSSINSYFRSAADGGIQPGGSTPTRKAITSGGAALADAYAHDTKKNCGRTYGVIVMTDGLSNYCNPSNGSWSKCPDNWKDYPAGASNSEWKNRSVNGTRLNIRTWAIGISSEIGRCELNYTAYKGRTDASSPNKDSGISIVNDPYLSADDTNVYDTTHGDYAFFASSVDELREALISIVSSMGAGDYTSSAPAVSGSVGGTDKIGMVASSEYPGWEGHLRGFTRQTSNWVEIWDAGEVLAATNNDFPRKIYTWNALNSLIEVRSANVSAINDLCNNCGVDVSVIDFIRGNDGEGRSRPWKLGALMNTTPTVIGSPARWKQGDIQNHNEFERTYASRRKLVWVGSSDGMIHAFDVTDGTEILALLPPDMIENQLRLYSQYLSDPTTYITGEKKAPSDHIFGIANSLRTADVWDSVAKHFRTVIFAAEGPGGRAIHAIDVTHPFPGRTIGNDTVDADPDYSSLEPVSILWSRFGGSDTGQDPDLGITWSIPSVGVDEIDHNAKGFSKLFLSGGYQENTANSISPTVMFLNPATGELQRKLRLENSSSFLVGNQAFADSSIWQTTSDTFHPDNLVDEAVQADLNGKIWSFTGSSWQTRKVIFNLGGSQPVYYSPALGSYPAPVPNYDLFAFGSGSFYELSKNVTGSTASFVPKLYVGVRNISDGTVNRTSISITDIALPKGYVPPDSSVKTLSDQAQVIASPIMLTPAQGSTLMPLALFLAYDPLAGECVGESFIIELEFNPTEILQHGESADFTAVNSYDAGAGTSGGFGMAGTKVIVSQSGVGEGGQAHIVEVPDLEIPVGNPGADNVRWWMELQ